MADGVDTVTAPENLATLQRGADAIDGVADLSRTVAGAAATYGDHAAVVRAVATVLTVAGLVLTLVLLVVRLARHRRWLDVRRAGSEAVLLTALAADQRSSGTGTRRAATRLPWAVRSVSAVTSTSATHTIANPTRRQRGMASS